MQIVIVHHQRRVIVSKIMNRLNTKHIWASIALLLCIGQLSPSDFPFSDESLPLMLLLLIHLSDLSDLFLEYCDLLLSCLIFLKLLIDILESE
jgi:hypothetical protein